MRIARNYVSGRVMASAVLCCAVLCCAVLCCAVLCCAVRILADANRVSIGFEKICFFLRKLQHISDIITRKFDFRGKFKGEILKKI